MGSGKGHNKRTNLFGNKSNKKDPIKEENTPNTTRSDEMLRGSTPMGELVTIEGVKINKGWAFINNNNEIHRNPLVGPAIMRKTNFGVIIEELYCENGKISHLVDKPNHVTYYNNSTPKTESFIISDKYSYHRDFNLGPAKIEYHENGEIESESYYFNAKPHRVNGPAITRYYENGSIDHETYYNSGKEHREDGPAEISYYESGKIKSESYYFNGEPHRTNGPAKIEYYENGNVEYEIFFENGKYNRNVNDGPGELVYNEQGELIKCRYLVDGALLSKEQVDKIREMIMDPKKEFKEYKLGKNSNSEYNDKDFYF